MDTSFATIHLIRLSRPIYQVTVYKMTKLAKKEDFSEIKQLDWCNALLNDPTYILSPVLSRKVPANSKEHTLFGLTLQTSSTIREVINLWHEGQNGTSQSPQRSSGKSRLPLPTENDLTMLVSLSSQMTSHPNILHGGICVMLMDEVVAFFVLGELKMKSGIGSGIFMKRI
jgi:hypothetical protein